MTRSIIYTRIEFTDKTMSILHIQRKAGSIFSEKSNTGYKSCTISTV